MKPTLFTLFSLLALSGLTPGALAADDARDAATDAADEGSASAAVNPTEPVAGAWRFSLTPYLWLTSQKGEVGIGDQNADVDLDLSDAANLLKHNFNGGMGLHAEAGTGPLSLFGDGMYLDLETSEADSTGANRASFTQGILELGAAYAVSGSPDGSAGPTIEPLIGARVYYMDGAVIGPAGNKLISGEETWVDAFVGARFSIPISGPFSAFGRGDVGAGGSDLAWNVIAGVSCDFGRALSLQAGYRWLDIDYTEGDESDRFAYDVLLQGPFIGLTWRF